jgi:hypothetical protein
MTIEEIIKEAFSQGWNASHECATDFDYEYALNNCLSELDSEVKKLNIPAVVWQSEQLVAFLEFVVDYKMLEVDLEYEEIAKRFLGN